MNKYMVLILIFLIFFSFSVNAEIVNYETISTESYKILIISDDLNIKYLNEYSYDIYLNNSFYGNFHKGEKILIPDNSNISIYIPESNIKTDITDIWNTGKTQFYIAVMYLISGFLIIGIIVFLFKKMWRK